MNEDSFQLAEKLLGSNGAAYVSLAKGAKKTRENMIRDLMHHVSVWFLLSSEIRSHGFQKKLPKVPWDDQTIELFLEELAVLDSNNFPDNVGVGEREGRAYSDLVKRRHFR